MRSAHLRQDGLGYLVAAAGVQLNVALRTARALRRLLREAENVGLVLRVFIRVAKFATLECSVSAALLMLGRSMPRFRVERFPGLLPPMGEQRALRLGEDRAAQVLIALGYLALQIG